MKKLVIGIALGLVLGILGLSLANDYILLKRRVLGIEQFLNNSIQQQRQSPQEAK